MQVHVIKEIERVNKEIVDGFKEVSSASVYEVLGKRGAMISCIKPLASSMRVCGSAVTVLSEPGDNIMVHKAVAITKPGDILVVSMGGYKEAGFWGEILTVAAQVRKIGGLVTDGSVRDISAIKKRNFPVFCQGVSIKGTKKQSLGLINYPILCGGVLVNPGDIILGDEGGVVVIPKEEAYETLKKCVQREKKEAALIKELKAGKLTLELYRFDKILKDKGLREK